MARLPCTNHRTHHRSPWSWACRRPQTLMLRLHLQFVRSRSHGDIFCVNPSRYHSGKFRWLKRLQEGQST
ncbi:hypothetical protein BJX96DRAFT_151241 [Aspergillus floccosus]